MYIHKNFTGGNITVQKIEGNTVFIERELRSSTDWFYWAFCVENAGGKTLTFRFPSKVRIGRFGPAISHDLENWHWQDKENDETEFTYTFAEDENKVYFAHHMLYHPARFERFCTEKGLVTETFCLSDKGRNVPCVKFGSGDRYILLTSRHHACESTGTYMLEGMIDVLLGRLPKDYSVIVVPFVDYDGVIDGDQGKNRQPYDHNRDYTDAPIYKTTAQIMRFVKEHKTEIFLDCHSPWHMWDINDRVFFSHGKSNMIENVSRFGALLENECVGLPLRYESNYDVGPNERWNKEDSPSSKNYMSDIDGMRLSVSSETAYFGVPDNKVTSQSLLLLGNAFGRALQKFL